MHRIARLCLVPLLPLTLADSLAWSPAQGASLTKSFRSEGSGELVDFAFTVDGEDMTPMLGDFWVESVTELVVEVTDEYVAVEDGRVQQFRRTFDTIGMSTEFEMAIAGVTQANESPAFSELEGAAVLFEWDADAEEWMKSFDPEGERVPDDALLEGLDAEMEMQALLPDGAVDPGDTWEIAFTELMTLVQPGGNLALVPGEMPEVGIDMDQITALIEEAQERFVEQMDTWGDGGIACSYSGPRDGERGRLAVVQLELDVTIHADLAAFLDDLVVLMTEELGLPIELTIHVAIMEGSVSGSGELLWNLDTGQVDQFDLEASYDLAFEFEVEGGNDTQTSAIEAQFAMEGTQIYGVTTE